MYKNWKILKTELEEKQEEYTSVANWCNENQKYYMIDDGTYYKVAEIPQPTPEEERERLDKLTRTRAEVWRALINARMFTKAQVREIIEALPEETPEQIKAKEIARIDIDDVEAFHRGHALVNLVGDYLQISSENLDLYFETGDYHYLEAELENNE